MDIGMFLVFPGILITIGVGLLIISIIIIIIAYKTERKDAPVDASKLSVVNNEIEENIDNNESNYINPPLKEENESKGILDQIKQESPKEEIIKEPTIDAFEEEFGSYEEKKKEPLIIETVPKKEAKEIEEEIELL